MPLLHFDSALWFEDTNTPGWAYTRWPLQCHTKWILYVSFTMYLTVTSSKTDH